MVFLSNLQVTACWITNLSLSRSSFLFLTPSFTTFFLSTLKFLNIGSVKHSFIHSLKHNYSKLNWNRIWTTVCTLTFSYSTPSTERQVNSMWTSTWRWNMTVRVKQKHIILIPQHHWSPTASHSPPLHPLLWPPAPPPLPHLLFDIAASGNFQKIGKKRAIICITSSWFWDLKCKLLVHTEANTGFVLDSEQKLRYSDN